MLTNTEQISEFQDRRISALSIPLAKQNRFQNKDETARLQVAYRKDRLLSVGTDFEASAKE